MSEGRTQSDEALYALTSDSRLLNTTEGIIFPLLEKSKTNAVNQMCAKFRGGQENLLTDIARITTLDDLIKQLRSKQQRGNKAAKELTHGNSTGISN